MMKTPEEEKKNGDDMTERIDTVRLSPNPPTPNAFISSSTLNTRPIAPRTASPEVYSEGSALEALLSNQLSSGDTVKTKNISPKPRHQRGVSWDLGIPETLPSDSVSQANNPQIAIPLTLNRGVSVPVPAIGKPPVRAGKTNRYNLMPKKPSIAMRKSSNNSSSHGSARSHARNRYGAMDKPSNIELEAESYLNEVSKDEVNAETNLMRRLDEKDPLRPRAGTGASILSDVPMDEMGHNFIIEDQDGLVLPSSESDKDGSSTRNKQTQRKSQDNGSNKRNMTVEQALFGLTSALTEMKAQDQLERQHHGHHNSVGTDGSKDLFDVAGALFDRAQKKTVTNKEPVEDKHDTVRPRLYSQDSRSKRNVAAGSRWGAIKNSLGDIKKAEEDEPNEMLPENGDVEEGVKEGSEGSDMDYSGDTLEENTVDHNADDTKKSRFTRIQKSKKVNPFKHLPYASKFSSTKTKLWINLLVDTT
jgi:hypothetical protein